MGVHGFSGAQSLLYHLRPPTQIRRIEQGPTVSVDFETPGPLKPRHLRTEGLEARGDAVAARIPLMGNAEVVLWLATPDGPMDYWYRFADGDEVLFVHHGRGRLESQFGDLEYRPGDYLVLPTGTLWRLVPDAAVNCSRSS